MLAVLSGSIPRVIALIDVPDLRAQWKRIGGAAEFDLTAVVRQLESGLAEVDPAWSEAGLSLGAIYLYSPLEADRPCEDERTVFKQRGGAVPKCWSCPGPCTHCRGSIGDPGGRGQDNPIANDLLALARDDAYDWAVVVSTDTWLIPVVRYLQSRGRKIIHGCFPPVAADLTKECSASIDLRGLIRGLE